jgi:predicted dehydrogenase
MGSIKTFRAGVIGLGVGEQHVAGYQSIPGVEVAAICDIDRKRLAQIGCRYEIALRCEDYRKITEHPDIDVVSICSYDMAHAEQVLSALRHGKHVMVEKPIVLFRHELEQVVRAQQESGCRLTSNLILRESPRFKALKRMIAAGEFGEIYAIEGDYIHDILWKITGGWRGRQPFYCVTYGGGIHLVDLMCWLVNDEVVEVSGMGSKILTRDCATFPYPDTITNLLRFSRGAIGKTMTTFGPKRPHFHALNVFGTKKAFVNDQPNARLFDGADEEDVHAFTEPYPAYEKGNLLPDFIAAIRNGHEPNVTSRDVFRVMDICFACWEAADTGRTVRVSYTI